MAIQTVNQEAEEQNFNLHAACQDAAECGFSRALTLHPKDVQKVAARLRGVVAIGALLTADTVQFDMGDWLRGGLAEAVWALATDAQNVLEKANTEAQKREKSLTA